MCNRDTPPSWLPPRGKLSPVRTLVTDEGLSFHPTKWKFSVDPDPHPAFGHLPPWGKTRKSRDTTRGFSCHGGGTLPVGEGKYPVISLLLSLDKSRKYH